jgi:hypothetical protein
MPSRHQIPHYHIDCVGLSDSFNHDRRIRRIGGVNPDGARWQISESAAIAGIEEARWRFCVSSFGRTIDVVVAVSKYGNRYLKTVEDRGIQPEILLALPSCR